MSSEGSLEELECAGSRRSFPYQDTFPFFYNATVMEGGSIMTEEERSILEERREQITAYSPPVTTGRDPDPVSGEEPRVPMSTRASIRLIHSLLTAALERAVGAGSDVSIVRLEASSWLSLYVFR